MKSLSVIIPCFNEEKQIAQTLETVASFVKKNHPSLKLEIIAVNDGSKDRTVEEIREFQRQNASVKLVNFEFNKGRGAAMKAGLATATSEYILFLDADLSYDVDHISDIVAYVKENPNTDAIIVSPYMKGGVAKNIPFSRLVISRAANWILSGFFASSFSTVTSMVRAYRTEVLAKIPLVENGKELHLEILRKLYLVGANVGEIPGRLIWKEKRLRGARISKKKIASSAKKHVLYGFLIRPTRFLSKVSLLILLVSLWELFNLSRLFFQFYDPQDAWYSKDLWLGLSKTFAHSPHTVVITAIGLVISLQAFTYLALFSILLMQHEENLRHMMMFFETNKKDA